MKKVFFCCLNISIFGFYCIVFWIVYLGYSDFCSWFINIIIMFINKVVLVVIEFIIFCNKIIIFGDVIFMEWV